MHVPSSILVLSEEYEYGQRTACTSGWWGRGRRMLQRQAPIAFKSCACHRKAWTQNLCKYLTRTLLHMRQILTSPHHLDLAARDTLGQREHSTLSHRLLSTLPLVTPTCTPTPHLPPPPLRSTNISYYIQHLPLHHLLIFVLRSTDCCTATLSPYSTTPENGPSKFQNQVPVDEVPLHGLDLVHPPAHPQPPLSVL